MCRLVARGAQSYVALSKHFRNSAERPRAAILLMQLLINPLNTAIAKLNAQKAISRYQEWSQILPPRKGNDQKLCCQFPVSVNIQAAMSSR